MAENKVRDFIPHKGFQENFISSNVDVVFGGSAVGVGKTTAAVMMVGEPFLDPKFRALFLRNNIADLKASGGMLEEFKNVYGDAISTVESTEQVVTFKETGAKVELTHIADQSKKKIQTRFDGRQYDMIYYDEGTGFTFECFKYLFSRNRGKTKYTGKVRLTTNPRLSHWTRTFVDWYIGTDGYPIPERDGVVRYFFIYGDTEKDIAWGDTKEEVYEKCKTRIDEFLTKANGRNGKATYVNMVKSFTLFSGSMYDNSDMTDINPDYIGSVAAVGGKEAMARFGNWNVDPEDDEEDAIPHDVANDVCNNDPMTNGDMWITADLADKGTDNFVALVWNGFHVFDKLIVKKSTPRQNSEFLKTLAQRHGIGYSHIVFDGNNASYMNDYIEEAIPYVSYFKGLGEEQWYCSTLKDCCAARFVYLMKKRMISISDEVLRSRYIHQNLKIDISFQLEFIEECAVVKFSESRNGKRALMHKKKMNDRLGKGRSMDLIDNFFMRMYPILLDDIMRGDELIATRQKEEVEDIDSDYERESIYEILGD